MTNVNSLHSIDIPVQVCPTQTSWGSPLTAREWINQHCWDPIVWSLPDNGSPRPIHSTCSGG